MKADAPVFYNKGVRVVQNTLVKVYTNTNEYLNSHSVNMRVLYIQFRIDKKFAQVY
jgi:hypothetical protein